MVFWNNILILVKTTFKEIIGWSIGEIFFSLLLNMLYKIISKTGIRMINQTKLINDIKYSPKKDYLLIQINMFLQY